MSRITTDSTDPEKMKRKYYRQFYTNKFDSLDCNGKISEKIQITKTTQEEI